MKYCYFTIFHYGKYNANMIYSDDTEYGYTLIEPYTKEYIDSFNINLHQDFYDYITLVSKECFCDTYPVKIKIENFIKKISKPVNLDIHEDFDSDEILEYDIDENKWIEDKKIYYDCINVGDGTVFYDKNVA